MPDAGLQLTRFHRVGAPIHSVALSGDGEHLLVGSERGLRLIDRRGNVRHRVEDQGVFGSGAFDAVALSPRLDVGLAMERAGRLYRLEFERSSQEQGNGLLQVVAVGIWEQRDDLFSLDFAPAAGDAGAGLIALGHHALGLTALDSRGQLLWRLGPRDSVAVHASEANKRRGAAGEETARPVTAARTWQAAISQDGRTIYAVSLGGSPEVQRRTVVAIDAALGKPGRSMHLAGPVSQLAGLPSPLGLAAVHRAGRSAASACCLSAYDAGLGARAWSLECPPEVVITAIAPAPGSATLIAGTNTGEVWRIGAFTGRILNRYDLLFSSTVLSVAGAETGAIAAGLANGQVAFLERVTHGR